MVHKILEQLYDSTKIESAFEALTVILHAFMLEVGFLPKDARESIPCKMPENWKRNGVCKIQYYHKRYPDSLCWMITVPFYSKVVVHGTITNVELGDALHITIDQDKHVNELQCFTDASKNYINIDELSRVFKDGYCFPILAEIQNALGIKPDFGLGGLLEDLKIHVMEFLSAADLASVSCVNKEFNHISNTSSLWKNLYLRDFKIAANFDECASEGNYWRDMYRTEYKRQQESVILSPHPLPHHLMYRHPQFHEDDDIDLSIDLDPTLQEAFPNLRRRFQQNARPPGFFQPNRPFMEPAVPGPSPDLRWPFPPQLGPRPFFRYL